MRWRIPRVLARAPIPVFRHGFGWVLGPRVLMLEHVGRTTGLARYVALEVVDRHGGGWVVLSAYGRSAQWLRNVMVQPEARVWWMRRRGVSCRATLLDSADAHDILTSYVDRNPRSARILATLTTGAPRSVDRAGLAAHLTREACMVSLSTEVTW